MKAMFFVSRPSQYYTPCDFQTLRKCLNTLQLAHYQFLYGAAWITYHALGHLCHLCWQESDFQDWKPDELLRDVLLSVSFLHSLMCNRFICVVQGLSLPNEFVLKSQTIPHVLLEETLRLFLFFLKESSYFFVSKCWFSSPQHRGTIANYICLSQTFQSSVAQHDSGMHTW